MSDKKQLNSFDVRILIGEELTKKGIRCSIPITRKSLHNFLVRGLPHDVGHRGHTPFNRDNVLKWLTTYKV